ncbi:hypothetical protein [Mycoplasma sp. ATU-Cv-703]|uniref:hypothetical protein n=1 Tax=Mycoplasma sp. ATU-Cv-703 TaxID=2498595 RepID=UPI000FDE8403
MKIDLHLHSPASSSNGDSIGWKSLHHALQKLKLHRVKVASFTDHNTFDAQFYLQARQLAKTADIHLLPGIEVDVLRSNDRRANLLIIFDGDLSSAELQKIEQIARQNLLFKQGISINKVNELFSDFETLRIPHVGKNDFFCPEDLKLLRYDAVEVSSFDHPNYRKYCKTDAQKAVVAFSDTHVWKKYPQHGKKLITWVPINEKSLTALKTALAQPSVYAREGEPC